MRPTAAHGDGAGTSSGAGRLVLCSAITSVTFVVAGVATVAIDRLCRRSTSRDSSGWNNRFWILDGGGEFYLPEFPLECLQNEEPQQRLIILLLDVFLLRMFVLREIFQVL